MALTHAKKPVVDTYLSKTSQRISYTLLKSWARLKKRISIPYRNTPKMNSMQEIALDIIKNACSSSETELHTFLSRKRSSPGRVYLLVNKKMEMRIYCDGRTQILTEDEFCDTRFPDDIVYEILNLVAKKMEAKRRIMEKHMDSKIQKRFKPVLEDLKK
jgi:hypothetical protein